MAILWRKDMSVGNKAVDKDHRYLICMINTVELALQSKKHSETLTDALEQLEQYTKEHFAREEHLQQKIRYPNYLKHVKEHQSLVNDFHNIRQKILTSIKEGNTETQAEELVDLLRHWLLDHVIAEDLKMKSYFNGFPEDYL